MNAVPTKCHEKIPFSVQVNVPNDVYMSCSSKMPIRSHFPYLTIYFIKVSSSVLY